jgi:hypothetical protein
MITIARHASCNIFLALIRGTIMSTTSAMNKHGGRSGFPFTVDVYIEIHQENVMRTIL